MSKHDNIYNILGKLESLQPKDTPAKQEATKVVYESVPSKGSILSGVARVEQQLTEKYMGFKKTVAAIKKGGSADNPEAVAASIGRKKYGKKKFQAAAAKGKKLGENELEPHPGAKYNEPHTWPKGMRPSFYNTGTKKVSHWAPDTPEQDAKEKAGWDSMIEESGLRLYDKIHSDDGIFMAKVYKDPEWNEYVVKYFKMGKLLPSDTWTHTDDIDDAIGTAHKEIEFMSNRNTDHDMEEGNMFTGNLAKARAQGKKQADLDGDGDMEKVHEGWDEMMKAQKERSGPQPKGHVGQKQGTRYGGSAQKDEPESSDDEKKGRGRPKKDKFSESMMDEDMLSPKDKKFAALAEPKDKITYADKIAGAKKKDEGNAFTGKLKQTQKGDKFELDGKVYKDTSSLGEGWDEMMKAQKERSGPQPKGHVGQKQGTRYGGSAQKDDDEVQSDEKKGRGRPKKDKFAETAPPGAKAERMVKHIKAGYAKNGKLTDKERSIAYATAWKAHNAGKLSEGINFAEMMKETHSNVEEMLMELSQDIAEFKKTGHMSDKLRDCLEMHKYSKKPVMDEAPMAPAMPVAEAPHLPGDIVYWRGQAGKVDRIEGNKCFVHKRGGDMDVWPVDQCSREKQSMMSTLGSDAKKIGQGLKGFLTGGPEPVDENEDLNELARLAGLTEAKKKCNHTPKDEKCPVHGLKECGAMYEAKSGCTCFEAGKGKDACPLHSKITESKQLDECGCDSGMDSMNDTGLSVNSSFDTKTGSKTLSVTAQGDSAEKLAQILKLAGLGGGSMQHEEPHAEVIVAEPEEQVEEEVGSYVNTPDEEVAPVNAVLRQGNDLNREKEQYADKPKAGDNPMATHESIEMPKSVSKMLEAIKKVDEAKKKCTCDTNESTCAVHSKLDEVTAITGRNVPSAKKGVRKTVDPATGKATFSGGTRFYDRDDIAGHQDAAKARADRMWQHQNPTLARARNFAQGVGQKMGQAVDAIARTKIAKKGTAGGF